jgi:tRNA A37 threonylcarbamoyladenosine dehydratase
MSVAINERTIQLLGEEKATSLATKKVVIFGLGGVGGTAYECLLRSGIGEFYLIDKDVVDASNLNRQILYTQSDIGKSKVEVASSWAKVINDKVIVHPESYLVSQDSFLNHDYQDADFIIDAVDDIDAKLAIIDYAIKKNIPFIISLGMGNRFDPSKVTIERLDKTSGDPLAKKLRKEARDKGLDLKKIMCLCSLELPAVRLAKPASLMMVPSEAGLLASYFVIKSLVNL